jgi:hypothetical protein
MSHEISHQPRFTSVPEVWADEEGHRRKLGQVLNQVQDGKTNNVYAVTLTPEAEQTVVISPRTTALSVVLLSPRTAAAAAAIPTTWVEALKGEIKFHHDNDTATDRTFGYTITA